MPCSQPNETCPSFTTCRSVPTSRDIFVFISPPGPSKLSSSPWAPVSNLGNEWKCLRQPDLNVDSATWSPEGERGCSLPHGKRLSYLIHLLSSSTQFNFYGTFSHTKHNVDHPTWLSSWDRDIPEAYLPIWGEKNSGGSKGRENGISG